MSKRTIIIAVLVVILFGAALFSCVLDFKKREPEPESEPEAEPEAEPEPETELIPELKPEP